MDEIGDDYYRIYFDLNEIISENSNKLYDIRDIIELLVDFGDVLEV